MRDDERGEKRPSIFPPPSLPPFCRPTREILMRRPSAAGRSQPATSAKAPFWPIPRCDYETNSSAKEKVAQRPFHAFDRPSSFRRAIKANSMSQHGMTSDKGEKVSCPFSCRWLATCLSTRTRFFSPSGFRRWLALPPLLFVALASLALDLGAFFRRPLARPPGHGG